MNQDENQNINEEGKVQPKPFLKRFSKKAILIIQLVLVVGGYLLNETMQVYCQPVLWAEISFFLVVGSVLLYPFLKEKNKVLDIVMLAIQGLGIWICIYLFAFLLPIFPFSFILIIVLIGVLHYLPVVWAIQIVYNIAATKNRLARWCAIFCFLLPIIPSYLAINSYGKMLDELAVLDLSIDSEKEVVNVLQNSFMGEPYAGMHFLYHTRFCEYDGWRPPIHDPLLVICMEFNNGYDLLSAMQTPDRVKLYRVAFPNKPVQADCDCSAFYSSSYRNHPMFSLEDSVDTK